MDAPFAKGTQLRQRVVVLQGAVLDIQFDASSLTFRYLLDVGGGDVRWFDQADVEPVQQEGQDQ